ncbi:MAG: iron-containing alcohol dehydrogenase family protein [Lachnospiraceae bacterium]|nr:iron-containing alcohol dehydrogenase family protein [Lachnospiraceae bacterium]
MEFFIPVDVYEGKDAVKVNAAKMCSYGTHALIVTGRSSAVKCGALDDVESALSGFGKKFTVFSEVEENPGVETVIKGRDLGLSAGADFVIGIGGGSPMDAAKAIAMMMGYPGEGVDYLYEKGPDDRALPIIEVPTTCGTGAEITWVSVLTRPSINKKGSIPHRLYPKMALADYRYLMKAPAQIIKNTSVDALAHLMESYVNSKAQDFTKMIDREGFRIWASAKDVLKRSDEGWMLTEEEASMLMHASVLAGMAITHVGTAIPHGLSYPLTLSLNMPHGKACGYFLADYLREAPYETVSDVCALTGFGSCDEMKEYIWNVCKITKAPEKLLQETADMIIKSPGKLAAIPYEYDENTIYRIAFGR